MVNTQKHIAIVVFVIKNYRMDVGDKNKNHVLAGLDFKKPFLTHFNHVSLVPGKRLIHI